MATEKEFDEYVGRVMRICQGIEHDIKLIYCGIREDAMMKILMKFINRFLKRRWDKLLINCIK